MPSYNETLRFLYDLQLFGIKVGLKNIQSLLSFSGNPERRFPSIHIAGTNGKGSTAAMIASILTASGYKTGLYTSPHLVHFGERIRIDGKRIDEEEIVRYTKLLRPAIERTGATFFEATTAMAFQYFADQHVDVAVIETGLGGRLDATNVLTPLLSIITTIGLDHTEYLGTTLAKIAYEKGGIIKEGVPCLTSVKDSSSLHVLKSTAKSRQTRIIRADMRSTMRISGNSLDGLILEITTDRKKYTNLKVSLVGEHQSGNARLAILAAEYLRTEHAFDTEKGIRRGLGAVQHFSGLRGRLDVISSSPLVIADVGHNPDGIRTALSALRKICPGKFVTLFGVMKDKDYRGMIREIGAVSRVTVAVQPETERALASSIIAEEFHVLGYKAIDGRRVAEGLAIAKSEARTNEPILVIGSHYVVGETILALEKHKDIFT